MQIETAFETLREKFPDKFISVEQDIAGFPAQSPKLKWTIIVSLEDSHDDNPTVESAPTLELALLKVLNPPKPLFFHCF